MTLEESKRELKKLYEEKHEAFLRTNMSLFNAEANGIKEAIKIVDKIDDESVGKSDTLTLTGLAYELGKLFHFKYLTLDSDNCLIWDEEPFFSHSIEWVSFEGVFFEVPIILIKNNLDLSEYTDENGNIDYSKCIVEVE